MNRTIKYMQSASKVHSVTYEPALPEDNTVGRLYVRKDSGFTTAKELFVTISTEEPNGDNSR